MMKKKKKDIQREARYRAPSVRVTGVATERSFLQSIQTGPITDWKEEPEPEIEF